MGESLAGHYIALDPSLWWNNKTLLSGAAERLKAARTRRTSVYLASSSEKELATLTAQFASVLRVHASPMLQSHYTPMPDETHGTIYHAAALKALRQIFNVKP